MLISYLCFFFIDFWFSWPPCTSLHDLISLSVTTFWNSCFDIIILNIDYCVCTSRKVLIIGNFFSHIPEMSRDSPSTSRIWKFSVIYPGEPVGNVCISGDCDSLGNWQSDIIVPLLYNEWVWITSDFEINIICWPAIKLEISFVQYSKMLHLITVC